MSFQLTFTPCVNFRSGLKTGMENGMFRSEIGSGFEDPGGTPPPRIPRSTPPPPPPGVRAAFLPVVRSKSLYGKPLHTDSRGQRCFFNSDLGEFEKVTTILDKTVHRETFC